MLKKKKLITSIEKKTGIKRLRGKILTQINNQNTPPLFFLKLSGCFFMKAILMICSSLKILKMSRLRIRKRRLQQRAYRRRRRIDILGITIFLSFLFVQMVFLLQEVFGKGRG